jgi:IS30 family transposase
MSYQRMTLVGRMDIFRLLYVEWLKPSAIATALNRTPSSITPEWEKGMDNGIYNPDTCRGQTSLGRKESADAPQDDR